VYKLYAESFKSKAHLKSIQEEAQRMAGEAFKAAGV
jgi:phosphoglucomutase